MPCAAIGRRCVSAKGLRAWYGIHKWTSLVCMLFLLLLCLTGLPLTMTVLCYGVDRKSVV